jgi:hypothetical protein
LGNVIPGTQNGLSFKKSDKIFQLFLGLQLRAHLFTGSCCECTFVYTQLGCFFLLFLPARICNVPRVFILLFTRESLQGSAGIHLALLLLLLLLLQQVNSRRVHAVWYHATALQFGILPLQQVNSRRVHEATAARQLPCSDVSMHAARRQNYPVSSSAAELSGLQLGGR